MNDDVKLLGLGALALLASIAASQARDAANLAHALLVMMLSAGVALLILRRMEEPARALADDDGTGYKDGPIRHGVIATAFRGVVGFVAGTWIAFQLAFPVLHVEWAQPCANFGWLWPPHISAMILAFGGDALIATSPSVVQRTSDARLWGGDAAWFVFWGYTSSSCSRRRATRSAPRSPRSTPSPSGAWTSGYNRLARLPRRLHGHDDAAAREAH